MGSKSKFLELLETDVRRAIEYARSNKLKYGEVSDGLYLAFAHNLPDLWVAIADGRKVKKTQLLSMMEENNGQMLHVEMVRLWLECEPSQDLIDECLYFVNDGLDLNSVPCIDSKEVAHELLTMLIEAGAREMYVLPYLLEQGLDELAEKLYARQKHQEWLQSLIGVDPKTDAWLLAKSTDLQSAQGSALLNALIERDMRAAFDKYLPLVDVTVPFSTHTSLVETALSWDEDYYFEQLLDHGAVLPKNPDWHDILWKAACNPPNMRRVTRLLEMGVDPNVLSYEGAQPLLCAAVSSNEIEMTKLLLDRGAYAFTPRNEAMFIARENGNEEMEQLLLGAGAPPLNAPDPFRPPFMMPEGVDDMETLWGAWLDFYHRHANDCPQKPIKGASEARIQKMEQHLGIKLPDDIRTMYRMCEGGRLVFFGTTLLTPEEVCEDWSELLSEQERESEGDVVYEHDDLVMYPKRSIRVTRTDGGYFAPTQHIRLVGGEHEYEGTLYLDLTPGETGTEAQLINIHWGYGDGDPTLCHRFAGSMTELVAKLLRRMAEGGFQLYPIYTGICFDVEADYDPETGEGTMERPTMQWFRDVMLA